MPEPSIFSPDARPDTACAVNNRASDDSVSVVMPVRNSARYLHEAVYSVCAQNHQNWQLILVDDASTDLPVSVLEQLQQADKRIVVHRLEHHSGPALARNAGIRMAEGRYIAFLDADDFWYPEKLSKQIAFMQQNSAAFSFTAYNCIDEAGQLLRNRSVPARVLYRQLLSGNVIGCSTAMYDTAHFGKVYMAGLPRRQDYALWLELLKTGVAGHGLQESLVAYRLHPGSLSANKITSAYYNWVLYYQVEKLGLLRSAYYFGRYAAAAVRERL